MSYRPKSIGFLVTYHSFCEDKSQFSVPSNAAVRLACRLPHCRFDGDFCTTAQAPLAAEGWPSGKQRHANRSITLQLCPPRQTADSWILFNSGAMPLCDTAKVAWPLRAATLKQQTMITRRSGKAGSSKLVWNQHKAVCCKIGPASSLENWLNKFCENM